MMIQRQVWNDKVRYPFDAQTFKHLKEIEEKNRRISERVAATPIVDGVHQITLDEVKAIIADENAKIENEIRHGQD